MRNQDETLPMKDPPLLRILMVAPSFDILGGQSVQAARLLARLRQEPSLELGFLAINPRLPGPLASLQKIKYLRTLVTSLVYVASLFLRIPKYDVIHVFSASYFSFVLAPTPAIAIGKLFGKRVLLNYHSGEAEDHLDRWRSTAIPTLRLVDSLIVPSVYLVRVFAHFGLEARAIFNLIETEEFPFRERQLLRPVFLSNRNLETHYGVDRVLRAFKIIQQRLPNAVLTVAGEGSQRAALEKLSASLALKNVSFVGRVPPEQIREFYDAADIYLNGSEIDNQPLSLLEAFACGLPIVTTAAGGIPDIISDGDTGFLVPRGNYELLAERAIKLLNDPALAEKFARKGKLECRKYSWALLRDAWMNVYEELARKYPKHSANEEKLESDVSPDSARKVATR
jgi:glycosyltransferase involved in cell wall biosynthesis